MGRTTGTTGVPAKPAKSATAKPAKAVTAKLATAKPEKSAARAATTGSSPRTRGVRTVRGVDGFEADGTGAEGTDGVAGAAGAPEPSVASELEANVGLLCGPCSAPPEVRTLESGSRLATFALRCPTGADGKATSVPVTVWDPPAWVETVAAGDVLVVVGRLRRRFYQRPGGLGSRVDLEAELVGRARDRRRIDAALRRVEQSLDVLR